MTTGTVPDDLKAYLDAVRARLDDLPAEERDDLLADVEPSILDSAGESDSPVELRLGPPDRFADELRAAAGLPPRADRARRRGARERLAAAAAFLAASPAARRLRELAPLWWMLRGAVAVGLVELVYGEPVFGGEPDGYAPLVALAVAVAVTVSVAAGLRHPRRNAAVVVVNLALVLAAAPVTWSAIDAGRAALADGAATAAPAGPAPSGLVYDGEPVQNVYAFDRKGRLLHDVRLFAQDGRPLEIGGPGGDPDRRPVRTREGDVALNAFPIRYFEPGTQRVADPAAGAPARPAPLKTEPLGPR